MTHIDTTMLLLCVISCHSHIHFTPSGESDRCQRGQSAWGGNSGLAAGDPLWVCRWKTGLALWWWLWGGAFLWQRRPHFGGRLRWRGQGRRGLIGRSPVASSCLCPAFNVSPAPQTRKPRPTQEVSTQRVQSQERGKQEEPLGAQHIQSADKAQPRPAAPWGEQPLFARPAHTTLRDQCQWTRWQR